VADDPGSSTRSAAGRCGSSRGPLGAEYRSHNHVSDTGRVTGQPRGAATRRRYPRCRWTELVSPDMSAGRAVRVVLGYPPRRAPGFAFAYTSGRAALLMFAEADNGVDSTVFNAIGVRRFVKPPGSPATRATISS